MFFLGDLLQFGVCVQAKWPNMGALFQALSPAVSRTLPLALS